MFDHYENSMIDFITVYVGVYNPNDSADLKTISPLKVQLLATVSWNDFHEQFLFAI